MQQVVWIFALIGAAVHLLAFAWEFCFLRVPPSTAGSSPSRQTTSGRPALGVQRRLLQPVPWLRSNSGRDLLDWRQR
jgi:hypothetical protein